MAHSKLHASDHEPGGSDQISGSDFRPDFYDLGNISGVTAIDGTLGKTIKAILTADATISVTGLSTGQSVCLWLVNSAYVVTYTTLIADDGSGILANVDGEAYPRIIVQQNDNSQTMATDAGVWRT